MKIVENMAQDEVQLVESLVRMHAGLVQPFEQELAGLLRSDLQVTLVSVDRRCFAESIVQASDPSCCMLLEIPGTDDSWLVDIGPCLVLPLVHRLLGGDDSQQPKPSCPFTPLQQRLMRCIVGPLATLLDRQWSAVLSEPLKLGGKADASHWLDREDQVFQLVLGLSFDQYQGFITLCLPAKMVESAAEAIAGRGSQAAEAGDDDAELETSVDEVELSVHLPPTEIAIQDLENLQVGEIIATGISSDDPLEVHLDAVPRYQAKAGTLDGQLAVRITGPLVANAAAENNPGDAATS
jgi:flagellar motor switch protein FliM